MEANRFAYRATAHTCVAEGSSGWFSSCDRDGKCAVDVLENKDDYDFGPSYIYTINTENVFNVNTVFHEKDGLFTGYTTTLFQEGRKVILEKKDCSDYLQDMTSAI